MKCIFSDGALLNYDINNIDIPIDVKEFWSLTESAILFKDVEFDQWGLHILPLNEAIKLATEEKTVRKNQYIINDYIIGKFIGDSDLLVISCEKGIEYGKVRISTPIDPRSEWPILAQTFTEYLKLYIENEGVKYWEEH